MRDYQKKYREEHKERARENHKKWIKNHPEYVARHSVYNKEYNKKWREKHPGYASRWYRRIKIEAPWLFHYYYAKNRCVNSNLKCYHRYGGRGIQFLLTKEEAEVLYKRDHAEKMKRPSIDRIDNDGGYFFDNCRFIEVSENAKKRD